MRQLGFIDKLLDGAGVEWKKLGELADNLDSKRKPIASGLRVAGKIPYYGASGIVDYVKDYIFDGDFLLVSEDGANLVARNTPIAFSISGKSWVNNHAHILKFNTYAERRYIEIYLNSIDLKPYISGAAQPKLNKKNLNSINIPIPCPDNPEKSLAIQAEIVRILDSFTALTAELNTELTTELYVRKKQYNFYRDKLLSFEESQVEWKTLEDVALDFGRGKSKHRPRNDPKLYGGNIPFVQTGDIRNAAHIIEQYSQTYTELGLNQSRLWPKGTLCITIAANIAETSVLGFDACFPDSVIGFVADLEQTNSSYVEYLLSSLKSELEAKGQGSAQSNINLGTFKNLKLPFPTIEKQALIVAILDKFDTLTNSISEGLPREIELRQKQYKYYRDLLFSFPKS